MQPLWGPFRLAVLISAMAVFAVAPTAVSVAQDSNAPQCSDGIDNDGDGAIDGADAGCADGSDDDESDSIYSGIVKVTVALPVVTIQGTVDRKGVVNVSKLLVRANRGSLVKVSCKGKHCPREPKDRTMITTSLRLTALERKLKPPMVLKIRIQKSLQLGKYVRYKVRKGKAPKRFDACLNQTTGKVSGCFPG